MSEALEIELLKERIAALEREANRCPWTTERDGNGKPCTRTKNHSGPHYWFTGRYTGTGDPFYDHD